MLGRLFFQLGVCALLCSCHGNYKKKSDCAADGGCPKAAACADKDCDAAVANDAAGHAAQAGNIAMMRTQAMRAAKDAGAGAGAATARDAGDAEASKHDDQAQADMPSKQHAQGAGGSAAATSGMKSMKPSQGGAGGEMMKPAKKEQAGEGGAGGEMEKEAGGGGAEQANCEQTCGPCQACADDHKTCQAVTGRDDADSCKETRSCSSRGECLHVSEAQADLGSSHDSAELKQSYAQVLMFSEPATLQEIRLEVSCNENDQTFPAVWLAAAPGGIPSDTIVATANVVYQAPTDTNTFALLELSKTLEEPAAGPLAIVVSKTDMSCNIRINKQAPYPNGSLFTQADTLWTPSEGSMVFQVLSSQ